MSKNQPPQEELLRILSIAEGIACECGELLRQHWHRGTTVTPKDKLGDIVTEADHAAEELIKKRLTAHFPEHGLLSEEGTALTGESDYCWIVDPLDGTYRMANKLPGYGVSLGLTYQHQPVLGVICLPTSDGQEELYSAVSGFGAFLDDQPIRVSTHTELIETFIGYDYGHNETERRDVPLLLRVSPHAKYVLVEAAAARSLCQVASGRQGGYLHGAFSIWDFAAGMVIIQEAGGTVTDLQGNPLDLSPGSSKTYEFLASNGVLHDKLLKLVA